MSRQITLDESVDDVRRVKLGEGVEAPKPISDDTTVICGTCGTAMKRMGPSTVKKSDYDGIKYDKGSWQFSCRACGSGSAKINLNPVPPMLEIEDDYFQSHGGNIIEVDVGLGTNHQLLPLSDTHTQNGYPVHPQYYNEKEHKDIDPPSKEYDERQLKIFEF